MVYKERNADAKKEIPIVFIRILSEFRVSSIPIVFELLSVQKLNKKIKPPEIRADTNK